MNASILTDSSSILSQSPTKLIFEYSFSLIDRSSNDVQDVIAVFTSVPSNKDWSDWLEGWFSCGYSFLSKPILKRIL